MLVLQSFRTLIWNAILVDIRAGAFLDVADIEAHHCRCNPILGHAIQTHKFVVHPHKSL